MATQIPGIFHNPAVGEVSCTGEDERDAWRSDKPLDVGVRLAFEQRDATRDEFQPEGGDWIAVAQAKLDEGWYLVVTGVPIADTDAAGEQ